MAAGRDEKVMKDVGIFDDVVLIEQKLQLDGYNEGFFKGQLIGEAEGYTLGVEKGKSFGQEVGFYDGFCSTLLLLYSKEPKSQRILRVLKQMKNKCEEMSKQSLDPQDQGLFDNLEMLRAKFKQISSILNATPTYGESGSGATDIGF